MDTSIKTNVSQNPIPSYVFTTLDINLKIDSLSDYLIQDYICYQLHYQVIVKMVWIILHTISIIANEI